MSEIYEKVSSDKVAKNIQNEAKEAGKSAGLDLIEKFKKLGFKPADVIPHIKRGIKEGADAI